MNQVAFGTLLAAALALILGAALVFVAKQINHLKQRLSQLDTEKMASESALSDTRQQLKDARKRAEDAACELAEHRKELGSHKKKKHTQQEEIRSLRQELVELRQDMEQQRAEKPAFADVEEEPVIAVKAPVHVVKPEPVVIHVVEEAPKHVPSENAIIAELRTDCSRLTEDNTKLLHDNTEFRAILRRQKEEIANLQRKMKDFQRIEMVTKNKSGLVEDKLKTLQRQHYDAISELAVLRGDVSLPRSLMEKNHAKAQQVAPQQEQ